MVSLRREFALPEEDRRFLDGRGFGWETLKRDGLGWLVCQGYSIPPGYTVQEASLALQIPLSYPATQIDMAYFFPHLARADGVGIGQLTACRLDERDWQRWSRHRTGANPWRSDVDCVETHLLLVEEWLERELNIGGGR